jgi:Rrf2 family protein
MSESQRFPVAVHALVYLAHRGARQAGAAVASAELAASMPTNPVVVRRVIALLAKAGLVQTRPGFGGGAWLAVDPAAISLDQVLKAVHGCAHLGAPPPGAKGCPVGEKIPRAVARVIEAADRAASERLSRITVTDLLSEIDAPAAA